MSPDRVREIASRGGKVAHQLKPKRTMRRFCKVCGEVEHEVTTHVFEPRPRGFAAMSPDRVREIASRGGKVAHQLGVAHQFTEEEAREAGRRGGNAPHKKRGRAPVKKAETETADAEPSFIDGTNT